MRARAGTPPRRRRAPFASGASEPYQQLVRSVFTDLTPEDSAAIVKDLERQGIAYDLKNDGAVVMVPRDKLTCLRST